MSVKVTYRGSRNGDVGTAIVYEGEQYEVGDEMSLSAVERDRLSNWFYFEDKDGGVVPPKPEAAPEPAVGTMTTESGGTVSVNDGGSSASTKASAESK